MRVGFGYFLQDPNGDGAQRAIRLSEYIRLHAIESAVDTDVAGEIGWQKVCAEIDAGHPVVLLVALAPAGHYITAIGYVRGEHTLVCHDPAGDNGVGYPNRGGEAVQYDWPRWYHGHPNLLVVPRILYARADPPPIPDVFLWPVFTA